MGAPDGGRESKKPFEKAVQADAAEEDAAEGDVVQGSETFIRAS
jgi:hypothetical protein